MLAAPEPGPFFERAVHYNPLSFASLDELEGWRAILTIRALGALLAGCAATGACIALRGREPEKGWRNRRHRPGAAALFPDLKPLFL